MFKKIMALCLVFTIGLSFFACGVKNEDANASKSISSNHYIDPDDPYPLYHNCDVSINGKPLPSPYYAYYDEENDCIALPIIAILKELGATVQWKSTSIAEIRFDGKRYILDTENLSLTPSNKPKDNMIILPPGVYGWYELVDGDYLITDITLKYFLVQLLDVDRNDVRLIYGTDTERASINLKIKPTLRLDW